MNFDLFILVIIVFIFQQEVGTVMDAVENNILDLYSKLLWIFKFATSSACTVLSVDQVSNDTI